MGIMHRMGIMMGLAMCIGSRLTGVGDHTGYTTVQERK